MEQINNLSPAEVKELIDSKTDLRLIDVRENWEYEISKIEDSELMPLSNFSEHINNLNFEDKIIVYCHHGVRSYRVCSYLVNNGFKDVSNLRGGINAWALEVDDNIIRY